MLQLLQLLMNTVLWCSVVCIVLLAKWQILCLYWSRMEPKFEADLRARAQAIASSSITDRIDAVCWLYTLLVESSGAGRQDIELRTARVLREQGAIAPLMELLADTRSTFCTPLVLLLMHCLTDSQFLDAINPQQAQMAAATLVQHLDAIGVPAELKAEHQIAAALVLGGLCSKTSTGARLAAEGGAIPKLVATLEASHDAKACYSVVEALIQLIKNSVNRCRQAAACGVLGAAARAVIFAPPEVQSRATLLMRELLNKVQAAEQPEQQLQQVVDACMCLLRQDTASELHYQATRILANLTMSVPFGIAVAMLQADILPLLRKQINAPDWRDRAQAVQLLATLLPVADDAQKEQAVALGVLEAACGLLDCSEGDIARFSGLVLSTCCHDVHHAKRAAEAGAVPGFVRFTAGLHNLSALPYYSKEVYRPMIARCCIALPRMLSLPCKRQHLQQAIDAGLPALLLDVLQQSGWEPQRMHQALYGVNSICFVLQLAGMLHVLGPLVEPLVQLLAQGSSLGKGSAVVVMALLHNIASGSPELREAVRAKGAEGMARAWVSSEGMSQSAEGLLQVLLHGPDGSLAVLPMLQFDRIDDVEAVHRPLAASTADVLRMKAAAKQAAKVCAMCGAKSASGGKALLNCSACKQVSYCGQQCQRKHWKKHKRVCGKGLQEEEEEG